MKKIISIFLGIFFVGAGICQNNPLWLRYPAISPDGQTILFNYKGIFIPSLLPEAMRDR